MIFISFPKTGVEFLYDGAVEGVGLGVDEVLFGLESEDNGEVLGGDECADGEVDEYEDEGGGEGYLFEGE